MPENNTDKIRQREIEKLESARDRMEKIQEKPNNMAVAGKGFLADPVTGELVPDKDQAIRAAAEARKTSNELRKAYGIAQADAETAMYAAIWQEVQLLRDVLPELVKLRAENDELRYQVAVLESPSGRVAVDGRSGRYVALAGG